MTGEGTNLYLNTEDEKSATKLWHDLLINGVLTKFNGARGVAIKPTLIFEDKHADQLLQVLSKLRWEQSAY